MTDTPKPAMTTPTPDQELIEAVEKAIKYHCPTSGPIARRAAVVAVETIQPLITKRNTEAVLKEMLEGIAKRDEAVVYAYSYIEDFAREKYGITLP